MLSITTNTSSLIAQNSLKTSTNKLNTAIERMSTGAKINHAKDNAANYSISTNMTTNINSLQVAEDNCAAGLDLINTASGSLDLISDKLSRIRALATQAANGTYGNKSLSAINSEAAALINEIYRIKNTTTYNGQKVYGNSSVDEGTVGASGLEVNAQGFLQDIKQIDTSAMTSLASVDETQTLAKGTYSISTAEELAKLATMQNSGKITAGSEFILGADIDLSDYSSGEGWIPIGGNNGSWTNYFASTLNGNGHKITNMRINRDKVLQGLIGYAGEAVVKNLGVEGDIVYCNFNSAGIVGHSSSIQIINCYSKVNIENGGIHMGGILGYCGGEFIVDHCYATGNITSRDTIAGGLVGQTSNDGELTNCFATGNVITKSFGGGLIGLTSPINIENCFATGEVQAEINAGGLVGCLGGGVNSSISNSHATGNVTSIGSDAVQAGGLVGCATGSTITNCYATGNVNSNAQSAGGLLGILEEYGSVENCFATGNVSGSTFVGGLIGNNLEEIKIRNSYATGNVTSTGSYSGGLGGQFINNTIVENCYATGNVNGANYSGGLIGDVASSEITNCYARGCVEGSGNYVGGLIGHSDLNTTLADCSALSTSSTAKGAIVGNSDGKIKNCSYSSYYEAKNISPIGSGATTIDDITISDITPYSYHENNIGLQVGTKNNNSSRIEFDTAFALGDLKSLKCTGIENNNSIELIDTIIANVSEQQTKYGAMQNRLDSALDEISTKYDNLVSSRSTIKDADISEVSSEYIKQQILQQASSTLMATANQTPALALQLL